MTVAYGQRLRLRLFLEGVEVPVIAANIQTAPNSPIVASIQIPPLAEGTRLLPRTLVHLYFLDLYEAENPHTSERGPNISPNAQQNPSAYEKSWQKLSDLREIYDDNSPAVDETVNNLLVDVTNERYKLLFGGEVMGFQWTKGAAGRSLVLLCQDWSNYWDYAYQWNNTGIFGPGIKAVFSGGATNLFTDFLSSKGSVITSIVSQGKCDSFPKLKGLAAGIVRLIEAIGGSYYPRPREDNKPVKKYAGQNIFFSLAELRLHITHMIAAYEKDPTSERLLKRQGYSGMFDRALGGLGGQVSIRKSISALTSIMFHETYAQPCPLYKPGLEGTVSGMVRRRLADDPKTSFIVQDAQNAKRTLQTVQTSLEDLASDEANILFPQGAKTALTNIQKRLASVRTSLRNTLTKVRGNELDTARSILNTSATTLGQAQTKLKSWRPSAPAPIKAAVEERIGQVISQLSRLETLTINSTPRKQIEPARLVQQILRPDIWFGAPPRCNVLFPENYDQLTYQRMFMEEPTRFLLKTNDEFFGEDFLFDKFYFAPQAGSLKKDQAQYKSIIKNDLLDHELFTGILPVFEKMGEFNVFAARSGTQEGKASKVGFAQRSANFLYFKHRFNSRQMRISGKFNPYIACGFPGLVIDKYVDQETIRLHNELAEQANKARPDRPAITPRELSEMLGTNYLGNFTQVTHMVSQAQPAGKTEITCSYPRQPEESIEFLGAVEKVQTIRKRMGKDALRTTDVAAYTPPKLYSLGPSGGRIINVVDVTSVYQRGARDEIGIDTSMLLPIFAGGSRRSGARKKPQLVPVGSPVTAEELNAPQVEEIAGAPDTPIVFRAYRVEEEIPRYRREEADLPAEEFIRPGWYGDVWTSQKIGQVYKDFFEIGAITDQTQIADPSGASTGASSELAEDALAEADNAEDAEDPRNDAPAIISLQENASIQQAVEFLLLTYSYIKQNGLDVDQFIRSYTWRPVASMVDMFGTSDLEFAPDGEAVMEGIEGFHSRAFGPYDNLFGLVGPDLEDILGIKRGTTTAQRGDTRARKLAAVQQMVSALRFSRAVLG